MQLIGSGGMGRVWLARDEVLGRDVAVKEVTLPAELSPAESADAVQRTLREARAAAQLSHPNAVRVYDVLTSEGRPWIVMEYVRGRSLTEVVDADGPLDPRRAAAVGLGVLRALRAAHQAGVLHRDVKPGNVLLGEDGRVVLTDFGIATVAGDPGVTRTGVLLGSPAYLSPERLRGRPLGPASDLWSLGATLFTAVEGHAAFDRGSPVATMTAAATEDPPPARLAGPLEPAIAGLLRRDTGERLTAVAAEGMLAAVAGDLAAAVTTRVPDTDTDATAVMRAPHPRSAALGAGPAPVPATGARRRRAVWVAVAVVVLVAAAGLGYAALARPHAPTRAAKAAPSSRHASTPPTTQAPSPTGTGIPAGFRLYRDRSGFALAIPANWRVEYRTGGASPVWPLVYFRDPNGSRYLMVDQTDHPRPDPVADWTAQEAQRRDGWADYHRLRIENVDYFEKAADWEFTYTDNGQRMHAINRGVVTSRTQAYGLFWVAPDANWADSYALWQTFTRTFQPGE